MAKTHQLTILCEFLHRIPLPDTVIIFNILDHPRFQNKKSSIDPAFSCFWFFVEFTNSVTFETDPSETCRGTDSRDSSQFSMRSVESDKGVKIDVRHAVTVSKHK